ncbi:hypothetical protein BDFG_08394, partial [Blastomyces dermatitidis ATCC 26199]
KDPWGRRGRCDELLDRAFRQPPSRLPLGIWAGKIPFSAQEFADLVTMMKFNDLANGFASYDEQYIERRQPKSLEICNYVLYFPVASILRRTRWVLYGTWTGMKIQKGGNEKHRVLSPPPSQLFDMNMYMYSTYLNISPSDSFHIRGQPDHVCRRGGEISSTYITRTYLPEPFTNAEEKTDSVEEFILCHLHCADILGHRVLQGACVARMSTARPAEVGKLGDVRSLGSRLGITSFSGW